METFGDRKIGLIISVILLTELSDLMVNRFFKSTCVYVLTHTHTQNVKIESFGPTVRLRSLNIRLGHTPK